jgi:hypothetical protein
LCLLGKFSIMAATPTLKPGHSSTVPRVKTKAHPDRLQTLSPKYHALQWLSSRQQHLLIRDQTLWWIQTGFFLFSICATTAKVSDCDPFLVRRKSPKKQKQQQQPITTHKEVLKSNPGSIQRPHRKVILGVTQGNQVHRSRALLLTGWGAQGSGKHAEAERERRRSQWKPNTEEEAFLYLNLGMSLFRITPEEDHALQFIMKSCSQYSNKTPLY